MKLIAAMQKPDLLQRQIINMNSIGRTAQTNAKLRLGFLVFGIHNVNAEKRESLVKLT